MRNRADADGPGRMARDVLKEGERTGSGSARPLKTEEFERVVRTREDRVEKGRRGNHCVEGAAPPERKAVPAQTNFEERP